MTAEHIFELARLIEEHRNLRNDKEFDEKTRTHYLPQYRTLETALRESGKWLEKRDEIVSAIRDALDCSEEKAIEYLKFYDEITQTK